MPGDVPAWCRESGRRACQPEVRPAVEASASSSHFARAGSGAAPVWAINAVGPDESAFVERSAPYLVSVDGNWSHTSQDRDGIDWVRSAWPGISRFGNGRSYLNFTGLSDEPATTSVDGSYGANLPRLAALKARLDPGNIFNRNNNITPGPSGS